MAKKRANGEGNIRKRKDGRWEGRYTVGHDPVTGKQVFKNVLGKAQAEVKTKLKKAIGDSGKLDFSKTGKYTVGQWMDLWFENYAKLKVRPSSHQTYEGYIKNHIKPNIGDIPIEKLTSLELQKFYKKLLTEGRVTRVESEKQPKGLSAKTVRNINQVISSAMDMAVEQKIILSNPTDGCALPKVEQKEMHTLPAEQLSAFLREAKESGVYELYYLDLATGLRRGELLGLKWCDIDLKKGVIHVHRQVARVNGEVREENKDFGGVDFYVSDSLLDILILAVKNPSLFQILFIGTCSRKQLIWMKAFSCITACLISSATTKSITYNRNL